MMAKHTHRLISCKGLLAVVLLAALNVPSFATSPDHQSILGGTPEWARLFGVVRIRDNDQNGLGFLGTGAVFGKRQVGNDFWLCVVTADHVARAAATLDVGFRNEIPDGARGPEYEVDIVKLAGNPKAALIDANDKQHLPDIAFLGVKVPRNIWDDTPAYQLADHTALDRGRFSIVGYGNTGIRHVDENGNWLGYRRVEDSYGTKRFANAIAEGFTNRWYPNDPTDPLHDPRFADGPYKGVTTEWEIRRPGADNFTRGFGAAFDGDSGAPYFASLDMPVTVLPDYNVDVKTEFLWAVHHGRPLGNNGTIKRFGDEGRGTELIPLYQNWLRAECEAVPEPASLLALGLGIVAIALRRRNRECDGSGVGGPSSPSLGNEGEEGSPNPGLLRHD